MLTRWLRAGMCGLMGVLLSAALGVGETGAPSDLDGVRGPGDRVPAMTLLDLAGQPHPLSEAVGKGPLLIFFWSVYCPNCKEAMPEIVKLFEEWRDRGLGVWAVNVDGDRFSNGVRAYVQDTGFTMPVLMDRLEGDLLVAADPFGVRKTPTLFLVDTAGVIRLRQVIEPDYDALRGALRQLVTKN